MSGETFIDFLDHYRASINGTEIIPHAYKEKFGQFIDYLTTNYSDNTDLWSTMIFPETEKDKNSFYCMTNNGLESLNRCLNRFVKNYAKGNMQVLGKYLQQFLQHEIEEVTLIMSGKRSVDISKISNVSTTY